MSECRSVAWRRLLIGRRADVWRVNALPCLRQLTTLYSESVALPINCGERQYFAPTAAEFQMPARIQIIFYSMYGHVYQMAEAVAAGARLAGAVEVSLWQVPELVPDEILERSGAAIARAAFA